MKSKHIVIVGGNLAGIKVARIIFAKKDSQTKVTLVSESSHAFFNLAAPYLFEDGALKDKLVYSVVERLEDASKGNTFEFVEGKAISSDFDANSITVSANGKTRSIDYDFLVIATGIRADGQLYRLTADFSTFSKTIDLQHQKFTAAKSVAILGGGRAGVEIGGSIGYYYGKEKNIVLYSGSRPPLYKLGNCKSNKAVKILEGVNVKVVTKSKATSVEDNEDGTSTLVFPDGSKEVFDLVIKATGGTANSEFIADKFLDSNRFLITNKYLQVDGHPNVFGFGDILSSGDKSLVDIVYSQTSVLNSSFNHFIFDESTKLTEFSATRDIYVIPISPKAGVGSVKGIPVPSRLIPFLKSKKKDVSIAASQF